MSSIVLTRDQEQAVHRAACEIVAAATRDEPARPADSTLAGAATLEVSGAFVTLKRAAELRSCYGTYGAPLSLLEALTGAAVGAATKDPRFPTIEADELPQLHLEVSLIHSIEPLGPNPADQIVVGRHGLVVKRRGRSGLLLPRVAVDFGLDAEGFLDQVCQKAGLAPGAWLEADAQLQRFQAYCFGGPFQLS